MNLTQKGLSYKEIIEEIDERNHRSNNLILFNLPESNATSSEQRKNDDVLRCLNTIIPDTNKDNSPVLSCVRLGTYNNAKVCPMKIMFTSPQKALESIKAYRRVGNLYLNRDLTPRQQNMSYLIRFEFKTRKEKGENDIVLKYRRGFLK